MQIYIYGAGQNGKLFLTFLKYVKEIEVKAFIDNDPNKQRSGVCNKECISISEAVSRGAQNEIVCISIVESAEIEQQLKDEGFQKVFCVGNWIRNYHYFIPQVLEQSDYCAVKPFNFYDSPYPDITEIHRKEEKVFDWKREVLDIDFNLNRQIELISEMGKIDLPDWQSGGGNKYRYSYDNTWFGKGSADALYYMMRVIKPKKIIEVGSGYSTAVMLDANEYYCNNEINIISIEPHADRLKSLLKSGDNIKICEQNMQEIPVDFFGSLQKNDILFIDSSHVSKIDSDVNYLFFEVLPCLRKGVYIHFHDIFFPFIYPAEWIYKGRVYSEMYILRAFLMNNKDYSIQLFGDMLEKKYPDRIAEEMRGCGSGSLWIRKESDRI